MKIVEIKGQLYFEIEPPEDWVDREPARIPLIISDKISEDKSIVIIDKKEVKQI